MSGYVVPTKPAPLQEARVFSWSGTEGQIRKADTRSAVGLAFVRRTVLCVSVFGLDPVAACVSAFRT